MLANMDLHTDELVQGQIKNVFKTTCYKTMAMLLERLMKANMAV